MNYKYDISALVLTYNPDLKKLRMTLKSFLLQEGVSLQIIVADDGSESDHFDEMEALFEKYNFKDYKLVKSQNNLGTVKNVANGLAHCDGKYTKTLSPGDYLNGKSILSDWYKFMEDTGVVLSASDAVYYNYTEEMKYRPVQVKAYPQRKNLTGLKLKINYLICNDVYLGAAIMCETKTQIKYINMLCDKAKYAEDTFVRLMVANEEKIAFFDALAVIYETGLGISTGKSEKWEKLISRDYRTTDKMILDMIGDQKQDSINKKIQKKIKSNSYSSRWKRYWCYMQLKEMLIGYAQWKFYPRMTAMQFPYDWMKQLERDEI